MRADEAKCSGRNLLVMCPTRDICDRFVRDPAPRQTYMMPPPPSCMGTLCVSFVRTSPDGRHSTISTPADPR